MKYSFSKNVIIHYIKYIRKNFKNRKNPFIVVPPNNEENIYILYSYVNWHTHILTDIVFEVSAIVRSYLFILVKKLSGGITKKIGNDNYNFRSSNYTFF